MGLWILTVPAASAQDKPNILFIFSDDHTWQTISAYGHPLSKVAPTPNIDRIGAEGIRFDRCLVTNSICAPSRAVVLTGKYSHLNGQQNNFNTFDGGQVTFPKLLQKKRLSDGGRRQMAPEICAHGLRSSRGHARAGALLQSSSLYGRETH